MKRQFVIAFTTGMFLFGVTTAHADRFNTKRCINMGNALDAPVEGEWRHTIEAASFQRIAEAGFDTVRIPIRWSGHSGGAPDYIIDEPFFERVSQVINQALAQDLQVIINIHHFDGLNKDPRGHFDQFMALWGQIAPRYRDLPETVYFEVINEPNGEFKGDVMRELVTAAFWKIRATNPTRILIMGGDNWSGLRSLPTIPVIDDPNQVYTFHYYDPFKFTHQKAGWTQLKNSGVVRWGSAEDRAELDNAASIAKQAREQSGVPIFLGEIGAYEKAPYTDVVAYTRATREAFEGAGISWCVWSFTATFPFFDSETKQWDEKKLGALGLKAQQSGSTRQATPQSANITDAKSDNESTLENAFNALRRDVGHDGELMMSPFADQLAHYGGIKVKRKKDKDVPGGVAMEIKVPRAGQNPWDAGLSGPLTVGLKKGDTLVLAYWARIAKRGEGQIFKAGLQMNGEPYRPLSGLEPATLTTQWQRFKVVAVADRDYAPGEAGYTFQLAGLKQTIRVGPVFVMNLGPDVRL
ncbi:MAG: glycoside hydrolase family 5 protein [Gammaproteobacteria bacterium]